MRRFTSDPRDLFAAAGSALLAVCGMPGPTQDLASRGQQPSVERVHQGPWLSVSLHARTHRPYVV